MATPDWVNYDEKVVGENHGSLSDVANRPGKTLHANALIGHDADGKHKLSGFQGAQYAADAEASDTYAVTLVPIPAAYFNGMIVTFKANTANTGAATLNVNTLGAIAIKKYHDQDLETGDIEANQIVAVVYNSSTAKFQVISQLAASTGTGAPVRATSPTLITPALGTPASGDLSNCTGGGSGIVTTSVEDEAEIALDTGKTGWGTAMAGDNEEYIEFRFTAAGVVTIVSNTANAINTDTDGNLCVYDAGAGIAIKNRLGATKVIRYIVNYS